MKKSISKSLKILSRIPFFRKLSYEISKEELLEWKTKIESVEAEKFGELREKYLLRMGMDGIDDGDILYSPFEIKKIFFALEKEVSYFFIRRKIKDRTFLGFCEYFLHKELWGRDDFSEVARFSDNFNRVLALEYLRITERLLDIIEVCYELEKAYDSRMKSYWSKSWNLPEILAVKIPPHYEVSRVNRRLERWIDSWGAHNPLAEWPKNFDVYEV